MLAWQLASELSADVFKLTDRPRVAGNRRFCEDMKAAAASAPANIAEGFGRFSPREFARFLRIARGSLLETRNHVLKAKASGYATEEESASLLRLQSRATGAVTNLLRYLDSCKGKAPTGWDQAAADKSASKKADANAVPEPEPENPNPEPNSEP